MVIVRPMGDRALLAEVPSLDAVLSLHRRLAASPLAGVVELVPAARTVLVSVDPRALPLATARAWIERAAADMTEQMDAASAPPAHLDIVYDGPDLDTTAALLGMSPDALAERHAAADWRVAFTGFAPGFAYLVSDEWGLDVPRLDTPRTRVPPGAVGLAAGFTGAYPRESPGGWRLIGTTTAPLWTPDAEPPALLAPGMPVRFRVRRATAAGGGDAAGGAAASDADTSSAVPTRGASAGAAAVVTADAPAVRIVESGLLATVQDLGRPGRAAQGIARSGALDRGALRTANRLVGNAETDAGIEITMGGFRAIALRDTWFAVAGAWGPVTLAGHEVDPYEAHAWPAGHELHVAPFTHGVRAYLAVRGGVDAPRVAGSRASDLMAGLGMAPLRSGDELASGTPGRGIPVSEISPWGAPPDTIEVELAPGARADWFAPAALRALYEEEWTVTNASDRTGMRLDGPELARVREGELPSEGMVPGALQVPPSGRPTILLADGPVTGGYPVIAVATDAALDALAQARPGARLRFRHARP